MNRRGFLGRFVAALAGAPLIGSLMGQSEVVAEAPMYVVDVGQDLEIEWSGSSYAQEFYVTQMEVAHGERVDVGDAVEITEDGRLRRYSGDDGPRFGDVVSVRDGSAYVRHGWFGGVATG